MAPTPPRRARRRIRGAQAVEFALVLPVFVILIVGIIDFGWYFNQVAIMNTAVRDACREGARTADPTAARVVGCDELRNQFSGISGSPGGVCDEVVATTSGASPDRKIKITGTITFKPIFGVLTVANISNTEPATVSANLTMHIED